MADLVEPVMIQVLYSCAACGLQRVPVDVPARVETEDVLHWVEQTLGMAMKADHTRRSPACRAAGVQDVMIPMTGAEKIGGPVVQ